MQNISGAKIIKKNIEILLLSSVRLGRNPPDIQGLEVPQWAESTKTVLKWNEEEVNASYVDIDISLFDSFEFRLHRASLGSFKYVRNSGSYDLDFSKENIDSK